MSEGRSGAPVWAVILIAALAFVAGGGVGAFAFHADRYRIVTIDDLSCRLDTWTGRVWIVDVMDLSKWSVTWEERMGIKLKPLAPPNEGERE